MEILKFKKNKIESLGIKKYFDKIIYARECKKEKPYKYSFLKIYKYLKCSHENIYFVGDSYSTDIIGASKVGFKTIYLNKKNNYKKNINYRITSLAQLMKIF